MNFTGRLAEKTRKFIAPKPVSVLTNQADAIGAEVSPHLQNQADAFASQTNDPLVGANPRPNLFSGTAAGVGENYANTLNQSLDGTIYDTMAAGAKEAMTRQAANKRAATAGQIAGAGFSGTGIGQTVAGATENDLTKQKYDTMIGIEQARNQGRLNALGEARAYGTAEEDIRRYEQNFDEDVRRFGVGEAKDAFESALSIGSDADVIARYKEWTGKDLSPADVAKYRGYARTITEQGIQANQNSLNSETGKSLAAAITNFPDLQPTAESINDPKNATVKSALQAQWDSIPGNRGKPMDMAWAVEQVNAVQTTNNTALMQDKDIDLQVSRGVLTAAQGKTAKLLVHNKPMLDAWVVDDPATGDGHFDFAKVEKAYGLPAGSLGGSKVSVTKPTKPDGSAYAKGESYTDTTTGKVMVVGADGNATEATFDPDTATPAQVWDSNSSAILKNDPKGDAGVAIADARAKALIAGTEPWSTLGSVGPGDPVYDRALALAIVPAISRSNDHKSWRNQPTVGSVVKMLDKNGKEVLVKAVSWNNDKSQKSTKFTSLDGKTTFTISVDMNNGKKYYM